eukprot:Tbor_TRINITY_DN4022_c0_g1::TRINITY_DN4022_c0_g1_i1::g.11829::m.11829
MRRAVSGISVVSTLLTPFTSLTSHHTTCITHPQPILAFSKQQEGPLPILRNVNGTTVRSYCTPNSNAEDRLMEEMLMLTSSPIPIGTLFKSLSKESRDVLIKKKLPIETFMLRHKDIFSVYKTNAKSPIMASRATDVPLAAMKGVEASSQEMFNGKTTDPSLHAIYTVLKYIPNEWSPYVSLGIPEEIRVKFMNKKPKAFFENHPKYFEVKAQALRSHTFEVRRSMGLQRAANNEESQD